MKNLKSVKKEEDNTKKTIRTYSSKTKKWYEVNKDNILQQKQEYRKENMETLTKITIFLCGGFL